MKRKYLILGASSEVGLAFIKNNDWLEDDEIVVQYCHNNKGLLDLKQKLSLNMTLLKADFKSEENTVNFCNNLKKIEFTPTHILHAPAIPIANKRFTDILWSEAEDQINVQCRSVYMILQSVIKKMVKNKYGRIIMILSSYTFNVPPKYISAYIMAKYALMGLGKALVSEYGEKNIFINMVSPSMMETKFLNNVVNHSAIEISAANNPLKRNASVNDVVPVIKYLFSENNTFTNGINIPITGGEVY